MRVVNAIDAVVNERATRDRAWGRSVRSAHGCPSGSCRRPSAVVAVRGREHPDKLARQLEREAAPASIRPICTEIAREPYVSGREAPRTKVVLPEASAGFAVAIQEHLSFQRALVAAIATAPPSNSVRPPGRLPLGSVEHRPSSERSSREIEKNGLLSQWPEHISSPELEIMTSAHGATSLRATTVNEAANPHCLHSMVMCATREALT